MDYRHATFLPVILGLLLFAVAGAFPGSTYAQQSGITVTVPEVDDPPVNETITLSIEADLGNNEVGSYTKMKFTFDDSALNIVDVRDGDELSFGTSNFDVNNEGDGTLKISNGADDPPVTGSGEFLEIEVELTQDVSVPFVLAPSDTEPFVPISVFQEPGEDGEILKIDEIDQGYVGLATIDEARQQGSNTSVAVQATVTRAFGAYVRFQDDSGPTGASGLVIRQTADNNLANEFRDDITNGNINQGTRLEVLGTLSEQNGLLRFNNADLDDYTILEQSALPSEQDVSLSDIQGPDGEDFESELLRIDGLSFQDPDRTGGTFDANTTYTIEDASGTSFPYRVEGSMETELIGASIPTGTFTYKGVLGQDDGSSGNDEGYRLLPVRTSTALPVELLGFDAVRNGSTVALRWQTASETNNAGFRVQHKAGQEAAQGWEELGFVESKVADGTTTEAQSYRFVVDRDLKPGTHRFRLEQVDLDGTTTPSRVVDVQVRMEGALTLTPPAPNPTSGRTTLTFGVKDATEAQIVLYNVLGQRVKTLYEGSPRAEQSRTLTFDTSGLPSGVYILQLRAEGQTRTQRLTVVR